jgi:hypothetical protein
MRRLVSIACGVGLALLGVAPAAHAAPPDPSAVSVSDAELAPGQTFTVTFELYNADPSTIISSQASLEVVGGSISDVFELVSCSGTTADCFVLGPTFRGPVGNLSTAEQRTVFFNLRVKETTAAGSYTFRHQYVGDNYAFETRTGPTVTVAPQVADLAVSLDASPRGVLTSRVTYTVAVANLGPGDASNVRVCGSYAAGFSWSGGSGCVRTSERNVRCDFAAVAAGGTASATFSVDAGLLSLGTFTTSVSRTSSSPTDPVSGNDRASRSCAALTGLLVRC